MSKLIVICAVTLLVSIHIFGQQVDNISYAFEKGMIVVRYDFLKGEPDTDYELFLYSSHDNFAKPMQMVTGDVGRGVNTGTGKVIYWDAKAELGNFKGKVNLKISGEKYIPLVQFDGDAFVGKIKRGRDLEIKWTSTFPADDKVQLKIQRFNSTLQSFTVNNIGSFTWNIPAKIKTGEDYSIRICKPENPLRGETSESFKIKTKIPASIKVLPAIVAAGAVAVIYGVSGGGQQPIEGPPQPPAEP